MGKLDNLRCNFDDIDLANPLPEHPNPYCERRGWISLNGEWDFLINKEESIPESFDSKIVVPYAVETELSGIQKRIEKDDFLHYHKEVLLPDGWKDKYLLLHFGAVDQECAVFMNGEKLGSHRGGYLPFSFVFKNEGKLLIDVLVKDDTSSEIYPRGKQMNRNGGIWYTPTSGIWQSVYLECLNDENYIKQVDFDGDFDKKSVLITPRFNKESAPYDVVISYKGKEVAKGHSEGNPIEIDLKGSFHPWSPEEPNLYEAEIKGHDEIQSVFGIRKIEKRAINGMMIPYLNDKPILLNGLLDQGYWPESGLTPPSEKAMEFDILEMKKLGFNYLRKHIKIEPLRWYYLCDKYGMLVSQDMVSGGAPYKSFYIMVRPFIPFGINDSSYKKLGRGSEEGRAFFVEDMKNTVDHLRNIPSIVMWTMFNEGWGQFDAKKNFEILKIADKSRLIDATSGWYDKGVGDCNSKHIYFKKLKGKNDHERIFSISEFGGYAYREEGHLFSSENFGYKIFKSSKLLSESIMSLYVEQVLPLIEKEGLAILVYTQLSDVEQETNGLFTYDRQVLKVDSADMKKTNEKIYKSFYSKFVG
ncbi:MAG: glycoside hydrolase family 2 [Bacilli bacterium]|nr:glycoside hydrolase family 2 [Bacilli bacterium]